MRRAPEDKARLNVIMQAVEQAFLAHNANNLERIDVLAKAIGFALSWSAPPDPDAAVAEFMRMALEYRDRFALLAAPPAGAA